MDAAVSEKDVIYTILLGLPKSFNTIRTAFELKGDELTMDALTSALLHEDAQRTRDGNTNNTTRAFAINRRGNNSYTETRECHYCHNKGHIAKDCRKRMANEKFKSHKKPFGTTVRDTNYERKKQYGATRDTNHEQVYSVALAADTRAEWLIDSGASQHMSNQREWFTTYTSMEPTKVYLGNNETVDAIGRGEIIMNMKTNNKPVEATLTEVLHVPQLAKNLFSISQATKHGWEGKFSNEKIYLYHPRTKTFGGVGIREGNLYALQCKVTVPTANLTTAKPTNVTLWHERLGHLSMNNIKKLEGMVKGISLDHKCDTEKICKGCMEGKQHRLPFPQATTNKTSELLQIVHSDVCGPMQTKSLGGARYYIQFTDDYSRKTYVYFMKTKNESLDHFKTYQAMAELHTGNKIKHLRSDNGGEYISKEFNDWLKQNGIIQQTSAPYTPEQNGLAERNNRTIVEKARCMLRMRNLLRSASHHSYFSYFFY
jgi:hypothetical protein